MTAKIILSFVLALISCNPKPSKQNNENGEQEKVVTYTDIAPILDQKCGGTECHGANGKRSPDLSTATRSRAMGKGVLRRIKVDMPPKDSGITLTPEETQLLEAWGEGGFQIENQ